MEALCLFLFTAEAKLESCGRLTKELRRKNERAAENYLMLLWFEESNRWDWTVETICLDGPNDMPGGTSLTFDYSQRLLRLYVKESFDFMSKTPLTLVKS